jgi:phosphoribosylanthranilate isomerase
MSRAKIKICGLSRFEDISYANESMPDYIGFVFAKSRRQVSPDTAAALRERLRDGIVPVGIFVNAEILDIASLYKSGIIEMAQLHGEENDDYITALRARCDIPIIKAVRADSPQDVRKGESTVAEFLLLDHGTGGTGERFDWALAKEIKRPFFLAGGITPDNIEEAIALQPYGIDVSSGAETDGVKDRNKIAELVEKVRTQVPRHCGLDPQSPRQ